MNKKLNDINQWIAKHQRVIEATEAVLFVVGVAAVAYYSGRNLELVKTNAALKMANDNVKTMMKSLVDIDEEAMRHFGEMLRESVLTGEPIDYITEDNTRYFITFAQA